MMKTVPAGSFKTHCLALLNEVAQTLEPIAVTRYGKPVAKIVPFNEEKDTPEKPLRGTVVFMGDVVSPIEVEWEAERE